MESYADALQWLYQRNQFSIKLGLESPRRLLEALGNPEQDGVFLHVAGTNGKGSVCANLAVMLGMLGYRRVGLYTSPHLVNFRERIRVNGEPVPVAWVVEWMKKSLPVLEELNPTYFECVTAMAFAYFKESGCDAVVLETGLGGRLDATNVVTPRISVITSISFDHTAILGDTLEAIWGEKLGIVKPGIPLVIDESRPELAKLAESKAREDASPFFNLTDRLIPEEKGFRLRGVHGEYSLPSDLRSESHQIRNAALSLLALEAFLGKQIPEGWLPALKAAHIAGRTQWIHSDGFLPVLLDGAHNAASVEALCRHLRGNVKGKPRFFFAVMRDKDFVSLYRQLRAVSDDIVYLDLSKIFSRALTADELRSALVSEESAGLREATITWEELEPLLRSGTGVDYAVFCGSLYLLGEIIPKLLPRYRGLEEFGKMQKEES
ncbi:MAG TPA: hypothetical protein DCQ83_01965 [Fibrobacteres bacterium]|jgi:dihydrofolate synthase/folylpolyglutamate synthase|nr:hypothetical protein [Fibrobacterota bacterium]